MSVTVSPVETGQLEALLGLQEGQFADVKAIDITPAKLTKTLSAFSNADGGELFIGIAEDKVAGTRHWRGFVNQEAANGHIQVFEQLFPLGESYSYSFLKCDGQPGLVLWVSVQKTAGIAVASDGTPYLRRGAQNLPVNTADALERLKLNKGIVSFESATVDVDPSLVTDSYKIIEFMVEVVPSAQPEGWLRKQTLIRDGKPTVASIVLFCDEPQAVLPKRCGIKLYRYMTSDDVGTRDALVGDPVSVEGCAYDQIREAVRLTREMIEAIPARGRDEMYKVSYPVETLHEIITNAVLHRDYSLADDIHIRIFDNRVEVESPGRLPAHITVTNILEERYARNPMIVRLINKFPDPPNKDVGEGLNTAFAAMRRLRLKEPEITEKENSVLVNIRHQRLASPEQIVMEYLATHETITNSTARALCAIPSENSMKTVFYRLRNQGLIEQVPGLKGPLSAWRKTAKALLPPEQGQ